MNRQEFSQQIKAGTVQGAYLFEGVEENIKVSTLQALRKALLPEGMEELNENLLDAPPTEAIIAACETLPFLAEKRIVVVRDHPALTGRAEVDDSLIAYLPKVPQSAVLIFLHQGKADGRKRLYGAIKKDGNIVSFNQLSEHELNAWIIKVFAAMGKHVDRATAALLSFTVGSDTALLRLEMDKLAALAGERDTVTQEDVRSVAVRSLECTVFEMVDAVVAGQQGQALRLMRDMLSTGEEPMGILAMLLRQFRLMQHIKIMQYENLPTSEIIQRLGMKQFAVENCIRQAKSYTGGQVKRAVQICLDTEYRIKSGQLNADGALEAAMLALFQLRGG